jgi:hypothetical protein
LIQSQKWWYLRLTKSTLKYSKNSFKPVSKFISKSKSQLKSVTLVFENLLAYKNVKMCVLPLLEENHSKWKNGEITGVMFMEMLELKKNTFYKIMREYEKASSL